MKLLIVGGVAGGASAAARARRLCEEAEIVVFERGPDVSFANCGLPYFIGGEIAERNKLLVTTPEQLRSRFNIDVRTRTSVESIDRQAKTIRVRDHSRQAEYDESYDRLILAPGAAPFVPAIPGVDLPGVETLRNLQDSDRIRSRLGRGVRHVVLIGGGFINVELAENFARRGVSTTILERNNQLLMPFDREMTTPLVERMTEKGVTIRLGESAEAIRQVADGLEVVLTSGGVVHSQLVVLGAGVRPESSLAVDAHLTIGPRGGIVVDEFLQTDDPAIYAVGDAIEVLDVVLGHPTQVPLAGPANRQGRIAAENSLGRRVRYRGTQGTSIVGFFDCVLAMTGASEKVLRKSGRPFRKVYVHPKHHAAYFPGAESMTLKLLFEPENGRVLGAQAVGGTGVDKRIDVLAVAIQASMTVFDLEEMELAYAPQFGSAKDPVNMAGFVASGLLRGTHPQIDTQEAVAASKAGQLTLLDVRTPAEYAAGHIPGATNLPLGELRARLSELPRNARLATYCQVGQRGYLAARILLQKRYSVVNVSGGFETYRLFVNDSQ